MDEELKAFKDEGVEEGVRRRVGYDNAENGRLVLQIPKRAGGHIVLPLLDQAKSTPQRSGIQDNTLMRIRPVVEMVRNVPVESGGSTVYIGKGVAMIRPGYLYVFFRDQLWRELAIDEEGNLSDTNVSHHRQKASQGDVPDARPPEGEWLTDILVPVFLQGEPVMHDVRVAYSEVAWSWSYIERLNNSSQLKNQRTTGIGYAQAALTPESQELSFETGFPAARVGDVEPLRARDLGVELMLGNPYDFRPDFEGPGDKELVSRLRTAWESQQGDQQESTTIDPADLALECGGGNDVLEPLREEPGVVAVTVTDPLFSLRHALTQLHLAQHYLDALDQQVKERPLAHSATLIRQALFDPRPGDLPESLRKLKAAVDSEKLDNVVEQHERKRVGEAITQHLQTIRHLIRDDQLNVVLNDYLAHHDLGCCEALALQGDLLNVLQQLPTVMAAQGLTVPGEINAILQACLSRNALVEALASAGSERPGELAQRLTDLSVDESDLTQERLKGVGLESLGAIAQNLSHEAGEQTNEQAAKKADKAVGLFESAMSGWAGAVLKALDTLRKNGEIQAIKLERLFAAVGEAARLGDESLGELAVMRRGDVDLTRYSIVGVHGEGLRFGLTDEDRKSEAMTRRDDYLFADRMDADGNRVSSTSPGRIADETNDAINQVAGHTWVFVLPVDNPAARKLSALKIDWANKMRAFADSPGLSRVLVGLAVFNLATGLRALGEARERLRGGAGAIGAFVDLSAALMKLHVVSTSMDATRAEFPTRALFAVQKVPVIGELLHARLSAVGAATVVRVISLTNFLAGAFQVGLSAWDLRVSLSRGDDDAALGHATAMAGGALVLAAPLMAGLLLIPGWGWAVLGIGAILGGSLYAASATDSPLERLLKQGPLGVGPASESVPQEDSVYYPQLLSQFCPLQVSATRFGNLDTEEQSGFTGCARPDDYVVTLQSGLISRFRIGQKSGNDKKTDLRLSIQQVEYTRTHTRFGTLLTDRTPLQRIKDWRSQPGESSVRCLVAPSLTGSDRRDIALRVTLQAHIPTELGELVFPAPALDAYAPYDEDIHQAPPGKERRIHDPFDNDETPYWFIQEVMV